MTSARKVVGGVDTQLAKNVPRKPRGRQRPAMGCRGEQTAEDLGEGRYGPRI